MSPYRYVMEVARRLHREAIKVTGGSCSPRELALDRREKKSDYFCQESLAWELP